MTRESGQGVAKRKEAFRRLPPTEQVLVMVSADKAARGEHNSGKIKVTAAEFAAKTAEMGFDLTMDDLEHDVE